MDNRTLTALEESIAKWERNAVAEKPFEYLTSAYNCPLCKIFNLKNPQNGTNCEGCPVSESTGRPYCVGTPYYVANTASDAWYYCYQEGSAESYKLAAHKAARDEVEFLKSLLPQEKTDG